jgi:hypothetical protein
VSGGAYLDGMSAELVEVLLLALRGALFAGMCWGTWLCFGEQPNPAGKHAPLERFATFPVVLVPLLAALGALTYV